MQTTRLRRSSAVLLLASILAVSCADLPHAQAQEITSLLLMRPHCATEEDFGTPAPDLASFVLQGTPNCPNFAIHSSTEQRTPALKVGDMLDMDILLFNQAKQSIGSVRSWLAYDPDVLEGTAIEIGKGFPRVTPGEADFSSEEGYVQIGISAEAGKEPSQGVIVVARIQMRVKAKPEGGTTPIVFHDLQTTTQGHAYVTAKGAKDTNMLPAQLGSLLVFVEDSGTQTSSSVTSSASSTVGNPSSASSSDSFVSDASSSSEPATASSSSAGQPERTSFTLLQVQNLRAGTEGSSVYLAWDALPSPDLLGYNVYYGTEPGRYIQRRSVEKASATTIIRGLLPGTAYYLALRGVSGTGEETAFSQEVAIKVGDPSSSTAPLSIGKISGGPRGNPLERPRTGPASSVPGAVGSSSLLTYLLLGAVGIGLLLAIRRHRFLTASPEHVALLPDTDHIILS